MQALYFARALGLPDERSWLGAVVSSCNAFETMQHTVDELATAEGSTGHDGSAFLRDQGMMHPIQVTAAIS